MTTHDPLRKPQKRFVSRAGAPARDGALYLDPDLGPEAFRQRVTAFVAHQQDLIRNLSAANIRLIQVGALVPPEIKAEATALAGDLIRRRLGTNDMLIPCGEDGFVVLFHRTAAVEADEKTRDIGDRLAETFGKRRDLRGLTPQAFTYDLTRYLDHRWAGTLDDLKRIVRQAYRDHVAETKAAVRRAEDRDRVRFAPVIAGRKRLLVGYDVRLYLEAAPDRRASPPQATVGSPAERAELTALTVERLAFRAAGMDAPMANVLLFLPVAPDILTNRLYWANFEAELLALPPRLLRRIVLNLDLTDLRDPGAFLARHRPRLAGRGRGLIVSLPIGSRKMADLIDLDVLGLAAVTDRRVEADLLAPFVARATENGFRSFWFEHMISFPADEVAAAQPTYFALAASAPEIDSPAGRYRRPDVPDRTER